MRGNSRNRSKVGPKVGFPFLFCKKFADFRTYFLTYFENSPKTYFCAFFSGISGLVAHAETKPIKKNHIRIWWLECPGSVPSISSGRPRIPGMFRPIYVEILVQGAESPRDRRDIRWDRWDMSTGQTDGGSNYTATEFQNLRKFSWAASRVRV